MTLGAAPSRFAPKMMAAEWKALWRFAAIARHIGETMRRVRRAKSSGGSRSAGFTAGYRMTLGAAPPRFAPKMMSGEWKALSASLVASAGPCA